MSSLFSSQAGDDGIPVKQRFMALAVIVLGTVITVLDASIVNVALPTISVDLNATPAATIWVANAYRLVLAATLMGFAGLGDLIGHRRVYTVGLFIFTLASLACSIAHSLDFLVLSRIIQGIGGAAIWSVSAALYRYVFPSRVLGAALGFNAMTVAVANGSGPIVGGAILSVLPWPWLFAINVPIGLIAALFALRALPKIEGREGTFDFPGVILSASAMGCFVVFLDGLSQNYSTLMLVVLGATSIASIWGFIYRQKHTPFPLIPLRIFKSIRFSMAICVATISYMGQGIGFIVLPFLFQRIYGYDTLISGLLFTPWPAVILFAAPLSGRLADRIGVAIPSIAGLLIEVVGFILLAILGEHASIPDILWRVLIVGLGIGICQTPNNREIMASVPRSLSGTASGLLGTARTFGQSLGNATVAIVLGAISSATLAASDLALMSSRVHLALWVGGATALFAVLISFSRAGNSSSTIE